MSNAVPMNYERRAILYCSQTGSFHLTPAQRRRANHKFNRTHGRASGTPTRAAQRTARSRPIDQAERQQWNAVVLMTRTVNGIRVPNSL